jgi:RNA polymerase sigma factor (sigma-70 family)
MPKTPLPSVLQAALSASRHGVLLRTDAELLASFAAGGDETAFAELVRRHGRLVRGAARRVAGNGTDVEDVFQATFLLLARKAAVVSWGPTVGPWLYRVACRIAAKARARAARRPRLAPLDRDVPAPAADPSAGLAWAEVRAALDDGLAALPAHLREPLVLCYLEGLTQDEAAAALGCSAATVKGRVARGRERLRRILARRGLSLATALAGPLVAESAIAAELAAATARAAAAFRATGAAPPAVRALLPGAPAGWKLAGALVALLLGCAAGAVGLVGTGRNPDPPPTPPPVRAANPGPPRPAADALGDPLPARAVARLGTARFLGLMEPAWAGFSPDGSKLAARSDFGVVVWDAATGRKLLERTYYQAALHAIGWRADGTGVAVVVLPDESYFVSAFTDAAEKLPNPPAAPPPGAVPNPKIDYLALSPDATQLAVVRDPDKEQFTIDLLPATPGRPVADLKPERTLGPFPGPCREVRYAAGGKLVTLHGPWEEKKDWSIAVIDPVRNAIARTTRIPAPGFCPWQYMLSLSADARFAAVAPRTKIYPNEWDGTIRVVDLVAAKQLCSVPFAHRGYGTGHAFTPDGKRLITSAGQPYFQIWDVATGREVGRSPVPGGRDHPEASAVAVRSDGTRFATARRDGHMDLWDTATGKAVVSLATHRDVVGAVALSPDGRLAATLGYDDSLRVWDLATGTPRCTIRAPLGPDVQAHVWAKLRVAFTPDSRGLVFSAAGDLRMAEPETGKPLDLPGGLRGRRGNVGGFAADGKTLVTFAQDAATLWDWPAGTARTTITVPPAPATPDVPKEGGAVVAIRSVALSGDAQFLFTNSIRKQTRGGFPNANDVWEARTGKRLHRLTKPLTEYPAAAFAPDSRTLYLGGHGLDWPDRGRKLTDALTAWDPQTGGLLRRFTDPGGRISLPRGHLVRTVHPLAMSVDGRLLAAGESHSVDAGIWVYETMTGQVVTKLVGHAREVTDLAFSADGRRLVSVSRDQTGLVWDVTLQALGGDKAAAGRLADAWEQIAGADTGRAYTGMAALAAAGAQAVPFLRARLRPAPVPTDAELEQVVGRLDAEAFADREKASADLERFGPNAVTGVKARLERATSREVRQRLQRFLGLYDGPEPSPYHLRCVRGVAIVEAIDTVDARALLAEWANGPADSLLTQQAQAASRRRGRR